MSSKFFLAIILFLSICVLSSFLVSSLHTASGAVFNSAIISYNNSGNLSSQYAEIVRIDTKNGQHEVGEIENYSIVNGKMVIKKIPIKVLNISPLDLGSFWANSGGILQVRHMNYCKVTLDGNDGRLNIPANTELYGLCSGAM